MKAVIMYTRDDNLIADLPANSTTYTDNTSRSPGSVFSYSVEAYNSIGASGQRTTGSFRVTGCANLNANNRLQRYGVQ